MKKSFVLFVQTYRNQILTTVSVAAAILLIAFAYQMYAKLAWMEHQIGRHRWQISSTLYAEAPVLYAGERTKPDSVVDYLKRLKYVRTESGTIRPGQYGVRKEGIVFFNRNLSGQNNSPILIRFNGTGIKKLVQLGTGSEIKRASMDSLALADVHGSRFEKQKLLQLREVPSHVRKAVIAIEDRRFYNHGGIDSRAIVRAAWNNCVKEKLQGGSTITQQVVKNFYLTPKKSIRRKITEAIMAIMMERKYDKDKILEFYLNNVYMGKAGNFNIRGLQEASRMYFKKDAKYLSVPEAALLAGMIQAPLRYNPYLFPEKAKSRRNTVLLAMKNTGAITSEQYEKYTETPLHVEPPDQISVEAPYFVQAILRQLPQDYSESNLESGGYQIHTTLDLSLQKVAEESIAKGLAEIDKRRFRRTNKKVQGCLIAVDPVTGHVKALVGGRDFSDSQFDRATQARRQPGSSFKPFVYATALESAFDPTMPYYTPATLIADEPFSMQVQEGLWEPENYNKQYYGIVTARQALTYSMNVATARLAQSLGVNKISKLSISAGLKNARAYPSLALGAFEVTPWDLISAYTVFANGGKKVDITGVRAVFDSEGKNLYRTEHSNQTVLHEETAYIITDMLKSVVTSGTAASLRRYGLTGPIAGKTGTSNEYRDAWFVGYTPNLICLVWVGYDDNTPVEMTGAEAALPIWAGFMKKALGGATPNDFHKPGQTVERLIDPTTGKLASWDCWDRVREVFIKGTEPFEYCTEEDHLLPPESFAGPRLRSAPVLVQRVHQPSEDSIVPVSEVTDDYELNTNSYDQGTDFYEPATDSYDSATDSNEPHVYIAAPDKSGTAPKAADESKYEIESQYPSETENTTQTQNTIVPQNLTEETQNSSEFKRKKEKRELRAPKNIDEKKNNNDIPPDQ